jgi:ABC-type uncharacterized transport system substrate-binding protein
VTPDARALGIPRLTQMAIATVLATSAVAMPRRVEAHPHVWITVIEELLYAPDGSITGVRQIWMFDDMFSSFATQGIEQKTKGEFTREELAPLAKTYIDGLKDYGYFTYAHLDGERQKDAFADPVDYFVDYDPKQTVLTFSFSLPFKTPVPAKSLEVRIYDPQLFFYLSFAGPEPVRLIGAPAHCTPSVKKYDDSLPATGAIAGMVTTSTSTIWVKCL